MKSSDVGSNLIDDAKTNGSWLRPAPISRRNGSGSITRIRGKDLDICIDFKGTADFGGGQIPKISGQSLPLLEKKIIVKRK